MPDVTSTDVSTEEGSRDSISQLVSSLHLSENGEEALLQDVDDALDDGETLSLHITGDEMDMMAVDESDGPGRVEVPKRIVNLDQAVLLDVQMVFHRKRGPLVKEMAFRVWNNGGVTGLNMRHDVVDVPPHLRRAVVSRNGRYFDVFTGMDLQSGDYDYDDGVLAEMLKPYAILFVKGANKKTALSNLYDRLNRTPTPKAEGMATGPLAKDASVYERPLIINVDGQTANVEDREFCSNNGITMATFSFPFVYANMHVYSKMLRDVSRAQGMVDVCYINNAMARDPGFDVFGNGLIVFVCHNDHSHGGANGCFGKKQRCSLVNLSILENLWAKGRDPLFRRLVGQEREEEAKRRKHQRQARSLEHTGSCLSQKRAYETQTDCYRGERYSDNNAVRTEHYEHNYNTYRDYDADRMQSEWHSNAHSQEDTGHDCHGATFEQGGTATRWENDDWAGDVQSDVYPLTGSYDDRKGKLVLIVKNRPHHRRRYRNNRVQKKRDATKKMTNHKAADAEGQ